MGEGILDAQAAAASYQARMMKKKKVDAPNAQLAHPLDKTPNI